jgi:hypothetical protein
LAAVTPRARFQEKVRPGRIFIATLQPYQSSLLALGGETPGGLLSAEPTVVSMASGLARRQLSS